MALCFALGRHFIFYASNNPYELGLPTQEGFKQPSHAGNTRYSGMNLKSFPVDSHLVPSWKSSLPCNGAGGYPLVFTLRIRRHTASGWPRDSRFSY